MNSRPQKTDTKKTAGLEFSGSPQMKFTKRFDNQFAEVVRMIHEARYNAIKSVNTELVKLYWSIGEYISKKIISAEWGDAVVDNLAKYIQANHPRQTERIWIRRRAQEALSGQLHPLEFLRLILEDEKLSRKDRAAKALTTRARFRFKADLEDWDQTFDREKLDKKQTKS